MREWRDVIGFEGRYQVSNDGIVLSVISGGLILKHYVRVTGHLAYGLSDANGKAHMRYGHRLVLEAFVGPRPPGRECCHRDGNPANNHVSNLYWGTSAENRQDSIRHGTHTGVSLTHCHRGHEFDDENTLWRKGGGRSCRACQRIHRRRNRAKVRQQRLEESA